MKLKFTVVARKNKIYTPPACSSTIERFYDCGKCGHNGTFLFHKGYEPLDESALAKSRVICPNCHEWVSESRATLTVVCEKTVDAPSECARCNSEPLMRFKDMSPSMEFCDECVSAFAAWDNGDEV